MSQEKVNHRLIKANIDLFSKIVKRPSVNEKVLSRPPFRFLFDLITMIIKTTGYLRGLYTEDEFNFENVNGSKESKIAFLDKLINVIGFINSKSIDVRSTKIVAGMETEKTNKLLNEFAKCIQDKKPFLDAVEKVRKGLKPDSSTVTTKANTTTMNDNDKKKITSSQKKPIQKQTIQTAPEKTKQSVQAKTTNKTTTVSNIIPKNETEQIIQNESIEENAKKSLDNPIEKIQLKESNNEISYDVIDLENNEISNNYIKRPNTAKLELNQNNQKEEQIFSNANDKMRQNIDLEKNPNLLDSIMDKKEFSIMNENLPVSTEIKEEKNDYNESALSSSINSNIMQQYNETTWKEKHNEKEISIIDEPNSNEKIVKDLGLSTSTINNTNVKQRQSARPKAKVLSSNPPEGDIGSTKTVSTSSVAAGEVQSKPLKSNSIKSARPKSSRPAPPRVMTASRSRLSQLMENRAEQFKENATNTAATVWIPETVDDKSDEFLISSQKLEDSFLMMDPNQNSPKDSGSDKGHLVQQLMATKSELEGQIKDSDNNDLATKIMEKPVDDMNQFRNQIQILCQSIGTLTKAMGYLHEDVRPMLDELKKWQEECRTNDKTIAKIRSEMSKDLEPLKKELEQIERQVDDYSEQIRSTRANVFRNEQIISKMIDSV